MDVIASQTNEDDNKIDCGYSTDDLSDRTYYFYQMLQCKDKMCSKDADLIFFILISWEYNCIYFFGWNDRNMDASSQSMEN